MARGALGKPLPSPLLTPALPYKPELDRKLTLVGRSEVTQLDLGVGEDGERKKRTKISKRFPLELELCVQASSGKDPGIWKETPW